jgi:hypothetical protein
MSCPRCELRGFQFPDNVPTCEGCGTRGLCFVVDHVHWKMWVPFPPEIMEKLREAADPDKIVAIWKTHTGVTLNRDNVASQLRDQRMVLPEPQNRAPEKSDVAALATPPTNNTTTPYLDEQGNLVIPYDCPDNYKFWLGGQSISETVAELKEKTAPTKRAAGSGNRK